MDRVTFKALLTTSEDGVSEALLSVPVMDRDGEVVDAKAFEPLPSAINLHLEHEMDLRSVVATGTPRYDDDGNLRATIDFLPDDASQQMKAKVAELVKRGTAFMSVGFMAAERERDSKGVVHVKRAELLEASFVSVPSNRQAAVASIKRQGAQPERKSIAGSFEEITERLQQELRARYETYVYVSGTFATSVVWQQWDSDMSLDRTYQADWSIDASDVLTIGQPSEVLISEVITPVTRSVPQAEGDTKSLADWQALINDLKEATK